MKITKEQLQQIIKEELEEMMSQPVPGVNMENWMEKTLWVAYHGLDSTGEGTDTVDNVARNFDFSDVDAMENFRNNVLNYQDAGLMSGFAKYITAVIDELNAEGEDTWGRY
jgi:hypothetical protein